MPEPNVDRQEKTPSRPRKRRSYRGCMGPIMMITVGNHRHQVIRNHCSKPLRRPSLHWQQEPLPPSAHFMHGRRTETGTHRGRRRLRPMRPATTYPQRVYANQSPATGSVLTINNCSKLSREPPHPPNFHTEGRGCNAREEDGCEQVQYAEGYEAFVKERGRVGGCRGEVGV